MESLARVGAIPALRSERVILGPVNPDDYRMMFNWQLDLRNLRLRWADRRKLAFVNFIEDLRRRLRSSFQVLFIVELI